jgi:hypothetical protein
MGDACYHSFRKRLLTSENEKIKVDKTIILRVVLMGVILGLAN